MIKIQVLNTLILTLILICVSFISYSIFAWNPVTERHTYYLMPDESSCEVDQMRVNIVKVSD